MAGLVPAIPIKNVRPCPCYRDARHKAGHDGFELSLDPREVSHGARRGADFVEQFEAVLAYFFVVIIDLNAFEERIHVPSLRVAKRVHRTSQNLHCRHRSDRLASTTVALLGISKRKALFDRVVCNQTRIFGASASTSIVSFFSSIADDVGQRAR
jgi:hypothetical protein